MKTRLRSRLTDLVLSLLSLSLLAAVFTACQHESGHFGIDTPKNFQNLTELTSISGWWSNSESGQDILQGVKLTLMRSSDNKFWNGTSWGTSFDLPVTLETSTWHVQAGTNLPSGADLQPGYYLIEAYADFTLEPRTKNVMFSVGVPVPPMLPTPWSWGTNGDGQMGIGQLPGGSTPLPVFMRGALEGKIVTGMSGGGGHTLALSSEGRLYSWGDNAQGQLGTTALPDTGGAGTPNNFAPVKVDDTGVLSGKKIAFMAAGSNHSLACSEGDGLVFAWGANGAGQIGNGTSGTGIDLPVAVTGVLAGKHVIAVSAGTSHSVALTDNADGGKLYAWGANGVGQVGDGTAATERTAPVAVAGLGSVVITSVDCGAHHNLAVSSEGKLYAWGMGTNGRLGTGSTANSITPVLITGPWGTRKIIAVSAGGAHSLAVDQDGKVYAWGLNDEGQLGTGDLTDRLTPVQVAGVLVGQDIHRVEAGEKFSLAQTHDDKVFSWGSNASGQLARSTAPDDFSHTPQEAVLTAALSGGRVILGLSAGDSHVEILTGFTPKPQPEIEVEAQGVELTSGGTINFGSHGVGTSNPIFITIRNRGTSDLTGLSVSYFDSHYHAFSTSQTVAPNGETGFYVFFAPNSTGVLTGSVQIPSNDADENPFVINFTGTGTPMGLADTTFNPDMNVTATIQSLSLQPDGKILPGGSNFRVNGPSGPLRYVARLDPATAVADSFNPDCSSGSVLCSVVLPDGKVMIGGTFTTVDGLARNRLARLKSDGTVDPDFNAQITFTGTVFAMALQGDGKLVVSGNFSGIGGGTRQGLARFNTDGTLDTDFVPAVAGGRGVAVQADGSIVVLSSLSASERTVARLSGVDGSLDPGFTRPTIITDGNPLLDCVAVQPDGKILVGGSISTVNGETRHGICRINVDGSLDPFFDPDIGGTFPQVTSIVVQADKRILIGGSFTSVGGQPRNRIAMLHPGGSLEFFFDPNADNAVRGIALQADGKVLAGGAFSNIGGQAIGKLARLSNDTATQSLYVDNGAIVWERGGSSPETNLVTFDVSDDGGTTWTPLGTGTSQTFPVRHWILYGATLPATGQIRARAYPQGGYYSGSVSLLQTITSYGTPPEIVVTENSVSITSGATREFGVVATGSAASVMQLIIQNTGGSPLTGLSGVTLLDNDLFGDSVDHTSMFILGKPAATTLAPGATTTMSVTYKPKTSGRHTAILRIPSNDSDEMNFDIIVTGQGSMPITTYKQIYFGQTENTGAAADTAMTANGNTVMGGYATGIDPVIGVGDGTSVDQPTGGSTFAPLGKGSANDGPPTGGTFLFHYQRNKLALADIVFQVEWSDTLAANDWHTTGITEQIDSDNDTIQQITATVPAGTSGQRFVRLKMTRP